MTRSKLKNVNLKSRNNENCANYKKLNFCILNFLREQNNIIFAIQTQKSKLQRKDLEENKTFLLKSLISCSKKNKN